MDFIFPTAIRTLAVLTITLLAMASPPASGASVADCDGCPEEEPVCVTECIEGYVCPLIRTVPVRCAACYSLRCPDDPHNPGNPIPCPIDQGGPDIGVRAVCTLKAGRTTW